MEVVATIAEGYGKGITRSAWMAQLRNAQQVLTAEQGPCLMGPTMVFGRNEAPQFASPHNDPLVVEMKIASAIVPRILVEMGSFVDIITWDCLKKLAYPGCDIVPLVHHILDFGGQEVNPTGMIHLPVRFGDKTKSKSLEVDFLIVDVPTAYNVILGRPTLYKVKAVIASYILQLQFEADNDIIGEMLGDQRTVSECYLVSIKPLIERTRERGPIAPSRTETQAKAGPATVAPKALVIHTLTSSEPTRPRPEATDAMEHFSPKEERPERTVQLGHDITTTYRQSLVSLLWEYKDVFVFGPEEMPSIAPNVMEHRLNVDPHHKLVM